jgi:hypothetical protein
MSTIYEITGNYLKLYEMLGDPDYADFEEAVRETLAECGGEFENKADNIAKVIKQLKADAEAAKEEAERIKKREQSFENGADYLRKILEQSMTTTGKVKFKTPLYTFYIGKNAPGADVHDPSKIPAKYWDTPEPVYSKSRILADLKAGIEVPGAVIKQSESLKIR